MTGEEAAKVLTQAHDLLLNYIVRVEIEVEKCKKVRGPNLKKMKDRATQLALKVDHARKMKSSVNKI